MTICTKRFAIYFTNNYIIATYVQRMLLCVYFTGVHDFLKEKKDLELGITPSTAIDNVNVGERQRAMRNYEIHGQRKQT